MKQREESINNIKHLLVVIFLTKAFSICKNSASVSGLEEIRVFDTICTASMNNKYDHKEIEKKWQEKWEKENIYSPNLDTSENPFYNLMMFPYPSAEGLHVGNMYAFTGTDVFGRFTRMQGKQVFEPIGLDGFGIHSENYALKVGRHPKEQAQIAEKNYYRQLKSIGNGFDWTRTVETYNPEYYKWTQWLFIQMFKNGLAYRKKAEVNWCPSCKTVLSDEQVIQGKCERCSSEVEKRALEQWFFRITQYADRLLNNIDSLNWTEKVKIAQRNWIGKSEGARVYFKIEGSDTEVEVFTTRPDTLHGATFMVVSPEHDLIEEIKSHVADQAIVNGVIEYAKAARAKSDIERTAEGKEKTGVFSGLYAQNPVSGEKIPIWIADYVLSGYGTGAIMAVPAHDNRDFEFAKKYELPIVEVIQSQDGIDKGPYIGGGALINSGDWNGWQMPGEMGKVIDWLQVKSIGERVSQYHLRDWLISRQRYWGPPIPMIYCENCYKAGRGELKEMPGWYSEDEKNLPVLLPDVQDWKPMGTGKAPLASHPEFYEVKCPSCGEAATRETDVSDTFLDSAWYFLRYTSTDVSDAAFDMNRIKKWLPVHSYIGGAEHSVLHLLYSRFVTMVLKDIGLIEFEEPFTRFFAHGLIIKDGAKMSKSKGNVVIPDEYIAKYGADTLRLYLMFLGPFSDGGDFRDSGIEGMNRFVKRVWKLLNSDFTVKSEKIQLPQSNEYMLNKTVKKVSEDINSLSYNTAIAALMEWSNFLHDQIRDGKGELSREEAIVFTKLIAPFAPHLADEIYQNITNTNKSIHISNWPSHDESKIIEENVNIAVQVNGKTRSVITISQNEIANEEVVKSIALKDSKVASFTNSGNDIKKTIYVPGKIINFVV